MTSESIAIEPIAQRLSHSVIVPGSKSYTNRALMAAALSYGPSEISGALFSDDTRYMAAALNQLGIAVDADEETRCFRVTGSAGEIPDVDTEVFVGNAGTAARFLTASLALGPGQYRIDGVARMRLRPMDPLFDALKSVGVTVTHHGNPGCFPATLSGRQRERGDAVFSLPGNASSQFISGLLLSAPCIGGGVTIHVEGELVSKPYLDMTVDVMRSFGVEVQNNDFRSFTVAAGQPYRGASYKVEPDASAASYFFAAAALLGGSVTVEGLGSESRQGDLDLVRIFERMGAKVEQEARRTTLTGTGKLQGVEVDMKDLSDVAQTLAVVAPFAEGPTRVTGIGFIRRKETDRIGAVVAELNRLGIVAQEEDDGYTIHPGQPAAAEIRTYDDHRMAMSFALIGLKAPGIVIQDPACTSKTFPNYFSVLDTLRAPG